MGKMVVQCLKTDGILSGLALGDVGRHTVSPHKTSRPLFLSFLSVVVNAGCAQNRHNMAASETAKAVVFAFEADFDVGYGAVVAAAFGKCINSLFEVFIMHYDGIKTADQFFPRIAEE